MRYLVVAAMCAGLVTFPDAVHAQDSTPESAQDRYLDALKACQAITVAGERLTCFDQAVGNIVTASDNDDLRIVDREEVRQTRRKLFGFSLPDLGIFGRDDDDDEPKEARIESLETTIAAVSQTRDGYILTTAEGARWQIDGVPRRLMTPRVGQPLEIRSAALTAYFLRINGQGGVKGRRIQ